MPTGPIYGQVPDPSPSWATTALAPNQVRETIRTMMGIPLVHYDLKQLADAMAAAVLLSQEAVESVKADVVEWLALEDRMSAIRTEEIEPGLPLIKADVIEYSEEPLKAGRSLVYTRIQPLREQQQRIEIRITRALSLCSYGLTTAPGCSGGTTSYGSARLVRS